MRHFFMSNTNIDPFLLKGRWLLFIFVIFFGSGAIRDGTNEDYEYVFVDGDQYLTRISDLERVKNVSFDCTDIQKFEKSRKVIYRSKNIKDLLLISNRYAGNVFFDCHVVVNREGVPLMSRVNSSNIEFSNIDKKKIEIIALEYRVQPGEVEYECGTLFFKFDNIVKKK